MLITFEGIVRLSIGVKLNANSSIFVRVDGNVIDLTFNCENAYFPIVCNFEFSENSKVNRLLHL